MSDDFSFFIFVPAVFRGFSLLPLAGHAQLAGEGLWPGEAAAD